MDGRQRTHTLLSMSGVILVELPQLAAKFRHSGCALSFWASLSTSTIFFLGRFRNETVMEGDTLYIGMPILPQRHEYINYCWWWCP